MAAAEGSRARLSGLSSRAFEHPADRAALTAMRKVPGFDLLLRKLVGFVGERGLRQLYLASAVRVSESQFSRVHRIYEECLDTLDVTLPGGGRPELFVAQTPIVNAGAIGVDRPFIVLNSGTLAVLGDEELRFVLGHELGHVLCDHVLYKTMLSVLMSVSFARVGFPMATLALYAIVTALKEWDRKSELSCDRAGLLCVQDPWVAYSAFMRMAGGGSVDDMDITEFVRQAEEYESNGDAVDGIFKLLNLLRRSHPFAVLRLAELKRWVESGAYQRIIDGEYEHRGDSETASAFDEMKDSARSYRETLSRSADPFVSFLRDVGGQVSDTTTGLWASLRDRFRGTGDADGEDDEPMENGSGET